MNTFIEKMMELGGMYDQSVSKTERELIIKYAEDIYHNQVSGLKNREQPNDLSAGVNLFVFLDTIDCGLELRRYANQSGRWLAKIEHSELKEGCTLRGNYGTGKSPEQAIEDYVQQIKGKLIVINAATNRRKEFKVPEGLFFACG